MRASHRPRIKICCIMSHAEAAMATDAGASALGLVASMPSGPGVIGDALIAAIARQVPPGLATFLLTSRQRAEDIAAHHRDVGTTTVQIVDALPHGSYARLRELLPGITLVQVIHVTGPASVDEALALAPDVDALLLDSGNPLAAVKELGGTGRRHDWALSRTLREQSPVPVYLAGGLRAENVREAIATVGPFGLDLCSGVRTNGALDERKLHTFMSAAGVASEPTNRDTQVDSLARRFLACTLPKGEWTHEAHLRVGLWHALRFSADEALPRLREAIRRYNVAVGGENTATAGYHETMTVFYVACLSQFVRQHSRALGEDALAESLIREYGARDLPMQYYTKGRLLSTEARLAFVAPDLLPLPV